MIYTLTKKGQYLVSNWQERPLNETDREMSEDQFAIRVSHHGMEYIICKKIFSNENQTIIEKFIKEVE